MCRLRGAAAEEWDGERLHPLPNTISPNVLQICSCPHMNIRVRCVSRRTICANRTRVELVINRIKSRFEHSVSSLVLGLLFLPLPHRTPCFSLTCAPRSFDTSSRSYNANHERSPSTITTRQAQEVSASTCNPTTSPPIPQSPSGHASFSRFQRSAVGLFVGLRGFFSLVRGPSAFDDPPLRGRRRGCRC